MKWKGKKIITIGDTMDVMSGIKDKKEAGRFMKMYRAESEFADKNIGYLTGYFGSDRAQELRSLFGVEHPIFGNAILTTKEALEAGRNMAKEQQ